MSAASGGIYTTVSRIRDSPSQTDISLVTLPAGTVLFRGIKLPTENPLAFYTDYLGTPSTAGGTPTLCLRPTHNVFFYAHPLVCFGAHNVGSLFDAVQMVVLVKDVNVVCMIRPSPMVRGEGKRYSGLAPIQRCSNFKESCGELTEDDIRQLSYDNCLSPEYQRRSSTRGWMAIANLDSIEPKLEDEQQELVPTMAPYLKGLERRQPGVGSLLTLSTYVDATRTEKGKNPRTGFPEIVLYPYATPPADTSLHQPCSTDLQAMALIAKHAKKDNLLYLPIVTITSKGVVDMIGGHFSSERVSSAAGADQRALENNLTKYLNTAMRYGVRLPFYGNGTISFDMRTGFYILPQVATVQYRSNVLPIDSNKAPATRKAQHDALRKYLVTARSYSTDTYKQEISLPTGPVPNSFIFARPLILAPIFKAVGITMPKDVYEYLKELSEAYKAARPAPRLTITAPTAPTAPIQESRTPFGTPGRAPSSPAYIVGEATPEESTTPAYGPTTPVQRPIVSDLVRQVKEGKLDLNEIFGGYGKPINPYGLTPEETNEVARLVAVKGGYRRTRGKARTRKRKDPLKRYAEQFSGLWKVHAKNKGSN